MQGPRPPGRTELVMNSLRHDVKIAFLAAAVTAVIAAPTGAVAAYVANADRVDQKHAVGAGASSDSRAGKLVATNGEGKLPNNIINKAADSARLGGKTLRQTQMQWLSVNA